MPTVANGLKLDWEFHSQVFGKRQSTLRLLSFLNHANIRSRMVVEYRRQGPVKYGIGGRTKSAWRS